MSFKPVAFKGCKRTPFVESSKEISAETYAEWAQVLYSHISREIFKGALPSSCISSFPTDSLDGAEILFKRLRQTGIEPPVLMGKVGAGQFWGLESLLSVCGQLSLGVVDQILVLAGQASLQEEAYFFQKKDKFNELLSISSEKISREQGLLREDLESLSLIQTKKFDEASSKGLFSSTLLPVFVHEHLPQLLSTDRLGRKKYDLGELSHLPALFDKLRGVVTEGTLSRPASAFGAFSFDLDLTNALLVLEDFSFCRYESQSSWQQFFSSSLKKWLADHRGTYERVEFVELSVAHLLVAKKCFLAEGISSEQVNPWGGALGRGICPPLESLLSLSLLSFISSGSKGLLVVPHLDGHLGFIEVRKP